MSFSNTDYISNLVVKISSFSLIEFLKLLNYLIMPTTIEIIINGEVAMVKYAIAQALNTKTVCFTLFSVLFFLI